MSFADPARAGADPLAAPFASPNHLDLGRLPPGPHGLPRAFVVQNQRNRILAGALDAVAEHGYPAVTVARIIRPATISRATFYEHFPNKEACVLAAYDLIVDWFGRRIAEAVEGESWPRAVMVAIDTALGLLAADPRLVRFCAIEILRAGSFGGSHYATSIERLAAALRSGRDRCPWGAELPPELEETAIGGVVWLIGRHGRLDEADGLTGLGTDLAYFLLTPYLGVSQAQALAAGAV